MAKLVDIGDLRDIVELVKEWASKHRRFDPVWKSSDARKAFCVSIGITEAQLQPWQHCDPLFLPDSAAKYGLKLAYSFKLVGHVIKDRFGVPCIMLDTEGNVVSKGCHRKKSFPAFLYEGVKVCQHATKRGNPTLWFRWDEDGNLNACWSCYINQQTGCDGKSVKLKLSPLDQVDSTSNDALPGSSTSNDALPGSSKKAGPSKGKSKAPKNQKAAVRNEEDEPEMDPEEEETDLGAVPIGGTATPVSYGGKLTPTARMGSGKTDSRKIEAKDKGKAVEHETPTALPRTNKVTLKVPPAVRNTPEPPFTPYAHLPEPTGHSNAIQQAPNPVSPVRSEDIDPALDDPNLIPFIVDNPVSNAAKQAQDRSKSLLPTPALEQPIAQKRPAEAMESQSPAPKKAKLNLQAWLEQGKDKYGKAGSKQVITPLGSLDVSSFLPQTGAGSTIGVPDTPNTPQKSLSAVPPLSNPGSAPKTLQSPIQIGQNLDKSNKSIPPASPRIERSQLDRFSQVRTTTQSALFELQKQLNMVFESNENLQKEFTELEEVNKRLELSNANLKKQSEDNHTRMAHIEGLAGKMQQRAEAAEAKLEQAQTKFDSELARAEESGRSTIEALNREVDSLKSKLESAENRQLTNVNLREETELKAKAAFDEVVEAREMVAVAIEEKSAAERRENTIKCWWILERYVVARLKSLLSQQVTDHFNKRILALLLKWRLEATDPRVDFSWMENESQNPSRATLELLRRRTGEIDIEVVQRKIAAIPKKVGSYPIAITNPEYTFESDLPEDFYDGSGGAVIPPQFLPGYQLDQDSTISLSPQAIEIATNRLNMIHSIENSRQRVFDFDIFRRKRDHLEIKREIFENSNEATNKVEKPTLVQDAWNFSLDEEDESEWRLDTDPTEERKEPEVVPDSEMEAVLAYLGGKLPSEREGESILRAGGGDLPSDASAIGSGSAAGQPGTTQGQ